MWKIDSDQFIFANFIGNREDVESTYDKLITHMVILGHFFIYICIIEIE